ARVDQRRRGHPRAGARAGENGAVAERRGAAERAVVGARGHRGEPRRVVRDGARGRAAVAGRYGREHAGVGGEHEGELDRVDHERLRTGERQVDHVDAVVHGLVDRGRDVLSGPTRGGVRLVPANLVDGQAGGRGHAGGGADAHTVDDRVHAVVAGGGAGGVRAVQVAVTRREELVRNRVGQTAGVEVPGADDLVVAGHVVGRVRVVAGLAAAVPLGRAGVGG